MNLFEAFEYIRKNPNAILVNKFNDTEIMRQRGIHFTIQYFNCLSEKFSGGVPIYVNCRILDSEWLVSGKNLEVITQELNCRYQ